MAGRLAYRLSFVIGLFSAAVYFTAVFYVGRLIPPELLDGRDYFTVTVIGIGIYSFTAALAGAPRNYLVGEIGQGVMETLLTLGPGLMTLTNAAAFVHGVKALGRTALVLGLAAWLGLNIDARAFPMLILVLIPTMAAALGLGYLQAAVDLRLRAAGRLVAMAGGAGTILSGVYFPKELLPGVLQWVADLLPATHAIAAARAMLLGEAFPLRAMGMLSILAALYLAGGLLLLRVAVRAMKRDGSFLTY
jgi:ABC-type polysaccharide/polyol phosphate export permease